MAENSQIVTVVVAENVKIEDPKSAKNGDVRVSETQQLENGDVVKIANGLEPVKATEEHSKTDESSDVAEVEKAQSTEDVEVKQDEPHSNIVDEVIREEIEVTETFLEEEDESSKNNQKEAEEGDKNIITSFEIIQINEKLAQSKEPEADEIITLQEVTILPLKNEQTRLEPPVPKQRSQLLSWDTKKTVFFYFFLFAFVVWIIAYYAFDTGLIPNDKKK